MVPHTDKLGPETREAEADESIKIFRIDTQFRIAVTVDIIATSTRVISPDKLPKVTSDA